MVTKEQQDWLNHLNNDDKVTIVPYDSTCEEKFLQIKKQIQKLLGNQQKVEHRGASSFKISGQDEIDIYIPVPKEKYGKTVTLITELYGNPRSNYAFKRARFVTSRQRKHIDIFVINENDDGWKDGEIFHNYLLSHPTILDDYRKLKENFQEKSTKVYYTGKIEFINNILSKAKSSQ